MDGKVSERAQGSPEEQRKKGGNSHFDSYFVSPFPVLAIWKQ